MGHSQFSGGLDTVKPAVLNDGLFVLLRHRDADVLRTEPPFYLGGYGRRSRDVSAYAPGLHPRWCVRLLLAYFTKSSVSQPRTGCVF
jgi:hypothetical protein